MNLVSQQMNLNVNRFGNKIFPYLLHLCGKYSEVQKVQ